MSLTKDEYAIYLPAVNEGYAAEVCKQLKGNRPFPEDLILRDLIFWEPNSLWYYPYLLHSVGLYSVGALPNNAVTQRNRSHSTLIGDSGGFQIGRGSMKGLKSLRQEPMPAQDAVNAWQQEYEARKWVVNWLQTYADYGMTIDMPLWAASASGAKSPFHNCSTAQLIDMTVNNLKFIDRSANADAKWLNVVQGGDSIADIPIWWDAVKWFRKGGWAAAGSAGARGGLANMLSTLLMMRDDDAFSTGQDWLHVLGVSTPTWAVLLTAIQRALRKFNPALKVSFDSSSPFQLGGRYEEIALTPDFTSDVKTWAFRTERAPQTRPLTNPSLKQPFSHSQSPLGQRLHLHHLNVRGGIWDKRQFDTVSNILLMNHNIWVYLDAMKTANELAVVRDVERVPRLHLECLDFIADVFSGDDWSNAIRMNIELLDAVAPSAFNSD
jgi:hypothetical protein